VTKNRDPEPRDDTRPPASWLGRHVLPPREGEHWLTRQLKGFARTGLLVIPILIVFEVGRSQGWW
jgi:hypothetical protein